MPSNASPQAERGLGWCTGLPPLKYHVVRRRARRRLEVTRLGVVPSSQRWMISAHVIVVARYRMQIDGGLFDYRQDVHTWHIGIIIVHRLGVSGRQEYRRCSHVVLVGRLCCWWWSVLVCIGQLEPDWYGVRTVNHSHVPAVVVVVADGSE